MWPLLCVVSVVMLRRMRPRVMVLPGGVGAMWTAVVMRTRCVHGPTETDVPWRWFALSLECVVDVFLSRCEQGQILLTVLLLDLQFPRPQDVGIVFLTILHMLQQLLPYHVVWHGFEEGTQLIMHDGAVAPM